MAGSESAVGSLPPFIQPRDVLGQGRRHRWPVEDVSGESWHTARLPPEQVQEGNRAAQRLENVGAVVDEMGEAEAQRVSALFRAFAAEADGVLRHAGAREEVM